MHLDLVPKMATPKEKEFVLTHDPDVERHSDDKAGGRRRSSLAALGSGDENAVEGQLFSMNDIDPA